MTDFIPQKPWDPVLQDPLPGRNRKPRTSGISMILDKGLGIRETLDLIELAAPYIDFLKLGFGTSMLYTQSLLQNKINLLREHAIHIYPGGTLLEAAVLQGRWQEFMRTAKKLGFSALEVSDGTVEISPDLRRQLIEQAKHLGFLVLSEVGKKESGVHLPVEQQLELIESDLACGVFKVILEGRESGKGVGIYEANGSLREDDVEQLLKKLSSPDRIIWEAPLKSQQEAFIRRLGPNVNLGNLCPRDIIAVEALRRGLRSDTLRLVAGEAKERSQEPSPTREALLPAAGQF